jgi:hypothetical protein
MTEDDREDLIDQPVNVLDQWVTRRRDHHPGGTYAGVRLAVSELRTAWTHWNTPNC